MFTGIEIGDANVLKQVGIGDGGAQECGECREEKRQHCRHDGRN